MKKKTIVLIILDFLALTGFFIFYGPFDIVRTWWITTSINTMSHKYFAYTFYNDEMIDKVKSENYYIPLTDEVDVSKIVIDTTEKKYFANKYEEQILKRDNPDDQYKEISIKVAGKYDGHLVAIYDPSKVKVITKAIFNTGGEGETIVKMCKRYNGTVCMSGGGSITNNNSEILDTPAGYVIEDGKIKYGPNLKVRGNIIGFNKENKLILTTTTGEEAISMGIRDGIEFGPFLIINGVSMKIKGDGGHGRATRTVIAQRQDGVVLFLVIDACEYFYCGATMSEIIQTLELYGAYNAANLDGGASTSLVINNKLVNKVMTRSGYQFKQGRPLTTGFALID